MTNDKTMSSKDILSDTFNVPNDEELGGDGSSVEENEDRTSSYAYGIAMSQKETSRIRMFRLMVVGMLLMTAAVTVMAKVLLSQQETQNFENAYNQFARTLADAAIGQQQSLRDSMKSLANEVTAYAQTSNLTWPYVYLPLWESYAMGYFDHSKGEFIGVNNHVTHDQRESFINWTTMHYQEWIKESHIIKYGNLNKLNQDPSKYNEYLSKKAKDGFPPDEVRPHYAVRTAQSPPMGAYGPLVNLNIASIGNNGAVIDAVRELRYETLVTAIKPFNALPPEEHQNFHTDSEADNPHSFMYAPVYEKVHDPTSNIVATLTSSVAWDASMQNLLPENVKGILCVVKNSCNQAFTYEVSGHDAFYLGDGDSHDPEFDHMEVEVDLALHTHPDFSSTPGHCIYKMHIFPTAQFRDEYKTKLPATFAAVVFSTFALVAIVFFLYDWLVQRRNRELVDTAVRSDRVVSSFFPGELKEKILAQQDTSSPSQRRSSASEFQNPHDKIANTTEPDRLAKEYSNTTVFFGDLAGFTAWSATRTPEQVFELLEHVYGHFDIIAKRRRVFKVETIGDCYVAATGLPNPQPDHAIRMTRFANDCMQKMNVLMAELSINLGPDTSNLQLRVGLHSGKITGGVLKGDKSRFQLFGDTMNTASRMESNGVPGRIHISKATADELLAASKDDWLVERKDRIVAKGKGEMVTYFASVPTKTATNTYSCDSCDLDSTVTCNHSGRRSEDDVSI